MSWFVAMTKPNHEAIAGKHLKRQGFSFYCPVYKQRVTPSGPFAVKPLFPRYIFIEREVMWRSLNGTRGISYVLMAENGPCLLPDSVIAEIKQKEDKKGYIQLEQKPKFIAGEKVKATDGPWAGRFLLFSGMSGHDRVKVLFEMMGRLVPIELDERLLVAA